jgi:L-threonylcarbamoyladenylate synthase
VDVTTQRYDCADVAQRSAGIEAATDAVRRGELVVLPTDTVYGIGADAFKPAAVAALLGAKGRGRDMPPPVLVGSVRAAAALIEELGPYGQDLVDEFWPGALTLICRASRTLSWDLGETRGTVAVRMPLHPVALELLKQTGPMAVSSANRSGAPPATTAGDAEAQLGESVSVYLDGGPCSSDVPSAIVDLTGPVPRLLRAGALSLQRLTAVAPVTEPDADGTGTMGGSGTAEGSGAAEGSGTAGAADVPAAATENAATENAATENAATENAATENDAGNGTHDGAAPGPAQ